MYYCSVKNVTITLDEETAAWARVHAAQHKTSVSRIVGDMLRHRMREDHEYERSMRCFLARKPVMLDRTGTGYPPRDTLHDRGNLR